MLCVNWPRSFLVGTILGAHRYAKAYDKKNFHVINKRIAS